MAALVVPVAAAAIVGAAGAQRLDRAADAQLESAAAIVAHHVESMLTARLRALESVAAADPPPVAGRAGGEARAAAVASLARLHPEMVWVGFTDEAGRVDASRGGLLAGVDMSSRPWWQAARQGPSFGDLHEATRLAPPPSAARDARTLRVLDVAVPIRGADHGLRGVLGAHLDVGWLIGLRDDLSRLLDATQGAIVRLRRHDGTTLADERLEIAADERGRGLADAWLDGRPMEAAVQPVVGDVVVERLRWQAVVMRDPAAHRAPGRDFMLDALAIGAAVGVLAAALTALVARAAALRPRRRP